MERCGFVGCSTLKRLACGIRVLKVQGTRGLRPCSKAAGALSHKGTPSLKPGLINSACQCYTQLAPDMAISEKVLTSHSAQVAGNSPRVAGGERLRAGFNAQGRSVYYGSGIPQGWVYLADRCHEVGKN